MNNREELRRKGNEIRERLQHGTYPVRDRPRAVAGIPGLRHYTAEAIFGAVWARPGLDIRYRMLATLSVLSSLQRLSQFQTYVHSALNMGLGAEEIQEVPIRRELYRKVTIGSTYRPLEGVLDCSLQSSQLPSSYRVSG